MGKVLRKELKGFRGLVLVSSLSPHRGGAVMVSSSFASSFIVKSFWQALKVTLAAFTSQTFPAVLRSNLNAFPPCSVQSLPYCTEISGDVENSPLPLLPSCP